MLVKAGVSRAFAYFCWTVILALPACPYEGDGDEWRADDGGSCVVGAEGCPCSPGGACDPGLSCLSELCVIQGAGRAGQGGGDTTSTGGNGQGDPCVEPPDIAVCTLVIGDSSCNECMHSQGCGAVATCATNATCCALWECGQEFCSTVEGEAQVKMCLAEHCDSLNDDEIVVSQYVNLAKGGTFCGSVCN